MCIVITMSKRKVFIKQDIFDFWWFAWESDINFDGNFDFYRKNTPQCCTLFVVFTVTLSFLVGLVGVGTWNEGCWNENRWKFHLFWRSVLLLQQITFSILIWNSKENLGSSTSFTHFIDMRRRMRVARGPYTDVHS